MEIVSFQCLSIACAVNNSMFDFKLYKLISKTIPFNKSDYDRVRANVISKNFSLTLAWPWKSYLTFSYVPYLNIFFFFLLLSEEP